MSIRVLVADDQALVRGSFRLLVDTAPDMVAVGEAATGHEAVELARTTVPAVVLMDIHMPNLDWIEATRRITASPGTAGVKVLILTMYDLDEYLHRAARRCQRVPGQGRAAGRPARRDPGRRGR